MEESLRRNAALLVGGSGAIIIVSVLMLARVRGETVDASTKVPFGAFICPALWLLFYCGALAN